VGVGVDVGAADGEVTALRTRSTSAARGVVSEREAAMERHVALSPSSRHTASWSALVVPSQ